LSTSALAVSALITFVPSLLIYHNQDLLPLSTAHHLSGSGLSSVSRTGRGVTIHPLPLFLRITVPNRQSQGLEYRRVCAVTHRSLTRHDRVSSSSFRHIQQWDDATITPAYTPTPIARSSRHDVFFSAGFIAKHKLRQYGFSCSDAADTPAWILVYGQGVPAHSQMPTFTHHVVWFYHSSIPIEQRKRRSITLTDISTPVHGTFTPDLYTLPLMPRS